MIIINRNISVNILQQQRSETIPEPTTTMAEHIGNCLAKLPAKQLGRGLRDALLLHLEDWKATCPGFDDFVTELAVLFARLDEEEDRQIPDN